MHIIKLCPRGGGDPKILKREGLDISFLKGDGMGGGVVCAPKDFFSVFSFACRATIIANERTTL